MSAEHAPGHPSWHETVRSGGARHKKHHFSESKPSRDYQPYMMGMSKKRAALALTSQGIARTSVGAINAYLALVFSVGAELERRARLISNYRRENCDATMAPNGSIITEADVRTACTSMSSFSRSAPDKIYYMDEPVKRGDKMRKLRQESQRANKVNAKIQKDILTQFAAEKDEHECGGGGVAADERESGGVAE